MRGIIVGVIGFVAFLIVMAFVLYVAMTVQPYAGLR